jgi:hypothetical protein
MSPESKLPLGEGGLLPAVLRELAGANLMDGDTEDYLREAADRLEMCVTEARALLDAVERAEAKLRAGAL